MKATPIKLSRYAVTIVQEITRVKTIYVETDQGIMAAEDMAINTSEDPSPAWTVHVNRQQTKVVDAPAPIMCQSRGCPNDALPGSRWCAECGRTVIP